jgi:hypothetical protein
MQIRPDEWKHIFKLRDDLDGEDRVVLRKLIKYVEHLERTIKETRSLVLRRTRGWSEEEDD